MGLGLEREVAWGVTASGQERMSSREGGLKGSWF